MKGSTNVCDDVDVCREVLDNIMDDLETTSISSRNTPDKKKSNCEMCHKNPPKYKCPKCFLKTCSLPCVKGHKELNNCDGVRCKTAYVPLSAYNENIMLSDYRLLEEIARCADNNERNIIESPPNSTKGMQLQLRKARSMNINLKLPPFIFAQHKQNSTFYHCKLRAFLWHILWHFPRLNLSLHKKRILDSKTVNGALSESCKSEACSDSRIEPYLSSPDICIYMKRTDLPSNETKYHKIDPALTIKSALHGKTIVEFPQFIIVMPEEAHEYEKNRFEDDLRITSVDLNPNNSIDNSVDVASPPKRQKVEPYFQNEPYINNDNFETFP